MQRFYQLTEDQCVSSKSKIIYRLGYNYLRLARGLKANKDDDKLKQINDIKKILDKLEIKEPKDLSLDETERFIKDISYRAIESEVDDAIKNGSKDIVNNIITNLEKDLHNALSAFLREWQKKCSTEGAKDYSSLKERLVQILKIQRKLERTK